MWINYLGDKKPIESLFSKPPLLREVRVLEIVLHEDGPRMSVRVNLNEFPDSPPKKWIANGFNRVQLTLVFIGLTDTFIRGWATNNFVSFDIRVQGNKFFLSAEGEGVTIESIFSFVEVEKITAYCETKRTNGSESV